MGGAGEKAYSIEVEALYGEDLHGENKRSRHEHKINSIKTNHGHQIQLITTNKTL